MTAKPLRGITFAWSDGSNIFIQTKNAVGGHNIDLQLSATDCVLTGQSDEASAGVPWLSYEEEEDPLYEALRLVEDGEYYFQLCISPKDFSLLWNSGMPFTNPRTARMVNMAPRQHWVRAVNDRNHEVIVVQGSIKTGSYVGVADFSFGAKTLRVEVMSRKIGYLDDFRSLLTSLSDDIIQLLFEVESPVGLPVSANWESSDSLSIKLVHLRRIMNEAALPAAIESLCSRPHSRLVGDRSEHRLGQGKYPDLRRLASTASKFAYQQGGPLQTLFHGNTPESLPELHRRETRDTSENRFVKAVLEEVSALLSRLMQELRRENRQYSLAEVEQWLERIDGLLSDPLWGEVGQMSHLPQNSQVMIRRFEYQEVARTDLILQHALEFSWDRASELSSMLAEVRPVFELYEYYCFFALHRVLRRLAGTAGVPSENFYQKAQSGLSVGLRKGTQSGVRFDLAIAGEAVQLTLYYNYSFNRGAEEDIWERGSYSAVLRPDLSLKVSVGNATHWLAFDAKYRLNRSNWLAAVRDDPAGDEDLVQRADTFKRSDLYKMHTYHDAIIAMRGAYVLYPADGSAFDNYVLSADPNYRQLHILPGVGAFPLRPGRSSQQEHQLEIFLRALILDLIHWPEE